MVLPRPTSLRASVVSHLARPARNSFRSPGQQPRWQRIAQTGARRGYSSSGGHSEHAAKSDLPWAIGAVVFTIPACWYLLQPGESHAHHDDHHKEHEEKHEEKEEAQEEQPAEEPKEEANEEPKEESKEESKAESKEESKESSKDESEEESKGESKGESKEKPKTDSSKDGAKESETPENKGSVDGVRFKGATNKGGDDKAAPDSRSHIPDAKGGAGKKRIDSDYAKSIGSDDSKSDAEGSGKDKAASSKEDSKNQMSGKQSGLSNTDTKHSTDIASDPSKSNKSEGTAETAKVKGTVSPDRPAV